MKLDEFAHRYEPENKSIYDEFLRQVKNKYGDQSTESVKTKKIIDSFFNYDDQKLAHEIISRKLQKIDPLLYVFVQLKV